MIAACFVTVARLSPSIRLTALAGVLAGCLSTKEPGFAGGCPANVACSATPVMVEGNHQFTSLAAGRYHTCGRTAAGEVWCWGLNTAKQLGGTTTGIGSGVPMRVGDQMLFTSVTAGELHSCGIANDDGAYCWGSNSGAVLGVESTAETCAGVGCSAAPVRAAGAMTFILLDAGGGHNCGLDTFGVAHCWGYNFLGELGSNTYLTPSAAPIAVSGFAFTRIDAGFRFTCAINGSGALYCWGLGHQGQLATGQISPCATQVAAFLCSPTPVPANTAIPFSEITTGAAFACGRTTVGALLCWGQNSEGQLGSGNFISGVDPVAVQGGGTWSSVAAGYFHACALRPNGDAFCWGVNSAAQLGDGSKAFSHSTPQPVAGGKTFMQIVAGAEHTCGLAADGTAWCWGSDDAKQLGRG